MPFSFLVMGVSGSGKSHIGRQLAAETGAIFIDADDYHSPENVAKMARGEPLTDMDRESWLQTLSELYREHQARKVSLVIGCSALKRHYRDVLRQGAPNLHILYLHGSREVLLDRLNTRGSHFFSGEHMLNSQLNTLELPGKDEAIQCSIESTPKEIIHDFLHELSRKLAEK